MSISERLNGNCLRHLEVTVVTLAVIGICLISLKLGK